MASHDEHPPALALRLVRWLCDERWLEEIEGDLLEYYDLYRLHNPRWKTRVFFWFHLVSFLRPYTLKKRQNSNFWIMFTTYLSFAWRYLRKHPSQTFTNLLSLSVGISSFLLLFIYLQGEFSFDKFHDGADRIYRVPVDFVVEGERIRDATVPPALNKALKDNLPQVESATRIFPGWGGKFAVRVDESTAFIETDILRVDETFLQVFDFPVLAQSSSQPLSDPTGVILTKSTAHKYFGDEDALGRELVFEGMQPERRTVTAIVEDVPYNAHFTFDILLKLHFPNYNLDEMWGWYNYYQYIKVKDGSDVSQLDEQMQAIFNSFNTDDQDDGEPNIIYAQPLTDIHLKSNLKWELGTNSSMTTIKIVALLGVFILLISLINYVNLTSGQLLSRLKEVGIRKTFGAGSGSLVTQFLVESLLLSILALIIGAVLAQIGFQLLPDLFGRTIELWDHVDALAALSLVILTVGTLVGLGPALKYSALGKKPRVTGRKLLTGRNMLLIVQFSASSMIIVGTIVVLSQLDYFLSADKGFNSQVLVIENARSVKQQDALANELSAMTSIQSAGYTSGLPGVLNWTTMMGYPEAFQMSYALVTPAYIEAAGFELIAGRNFREGNEADMSEMHIIVNEAAASALAFDPSDLEASIPLNVEDDTIQYGKVIGIVKDFHFTDFKTAIKPFAFIYRPGNRQNLVINVQSQDLRTTLADIEAVWNRFSNNLPMTSYFLDEKFDSLHAQENRLSRILLILCFLSLFLSLTGMLGIVNFLVKKRLKEIALRKVLGASGAQLIYTLTGSFLLLVLLANAIGLPVAFVAMQDWLSNFNYRVQLAPQHFLAALGSTTIIAGVLVGMRSALTASSNLIERLRDE